MKYLLAISLVLTLFLNPVITIAQEKNKDIPKPNIIIFLVDDMGWQDTSVHFYKEKTKWNSIYHTPNMERLASEGMKFTNAYATAVCTPSRISLLTGMNPIHHKVTNWTFKKNESEEGDSDLVTIPEWNLNGLSNDPTLAKSINATPFSALFQKNGYRTIHVGKAHFGAYKTDGENPLNLGFDINIGGHAAGQPKSYLGIENFGNKDGVTDERAVP
jgi:arylsulfatase A-like enzyme